MEPLVRFERHGDVAVLTLNRADKRNALNLALWGELEAHIAAIEALGEAIEFSLAELVSAVQPA